MNGVSVHELLCQCAKAMAVVSVYVNTCKLDENKYV